MAEASRATVLTTAEIASIVGASLPDPFVLLGLHPLGPEGSSRLEIRAFLPGAETVSVLPEDGRRARPMHRVDPDGLFVWRSRGACASFGYRLGAILRDGSSLICEDPYRFLPQLGDLDLFLFCEGTHLRLYDMLGARPWSCGSVQGVLFAVWAPNAATVSVMGGFDGWDRRRHPMRLRGSTGIWELFVPGVRCGDLYKFSIRSRKGELLEKADPVAFRYEFRPATASVVEPEADWTWSDEAWMRTRAGRSVVESPMSVYELHAQSWRRPSDGRIFPGWDDLGDDLITYAKGLGFTHLELLPVMEHPLDGSWGYQTLGYFAPTSRLGSPADFARFVDRCHGAGLGVILDWTPAHFPADPHGLARFDGTALYEHEDPRLGRHPDWDTLVFNYGRTEVREFLRASALFWLDRFHVDGLRVDAVASMLYLDYSRKPGEWIPNRSGGRENLDAVSFLKDLNIRAHGLFPGAFVIAEESTAWPAVSRPVDTGGLGFTLKWNMGWMHDTLRFFSLDPVHRKSSMNDLTFSLLYAYTENFVLPFSHDEVVHGKSSMLGKMPGDDWQKFANLRLLLAYQWGHPGKKLLFMGSELGQWREWDSGGSLDWSLLEHPRHAGLSRLIGDLNRMYVEESPFWEQDATPAGFRWIDFSDSSATVASFRRIDAGGREVICIYNFTPVPRQGYRIGVPEPGRYLELLNTDAGIYGGTGKGNLGAVLAEQDPCHGLPCSVALTLPPLAAVFLRRE